MPEPHQDSGPSTEAHATTPGPPDRNADRSAATRRSWDAYAAIIATMIGLLALLVSGYTAYVQRQQLRAQIWPYLVVASSDVGPEIGLHVINSGTGPARVVAVRVAIDHRPVKNWHDAQVALGRQPGGVVHSSLSNTVLPAGKDLSFVRPFSDDQAEAFVAAFLGDKHAVAVSLCYCSVLDECWLTMRRSVPQPIDAPDACPIPAAERFEQ